MRPLFAFSILLCSWRLEAQPCPAVTFMRASEVAITNSQGHAGIVPLADGSYTLHRYIGRTPFNKVGTQTGVQRQFTACTPLGVRTPLLPVETGIAKRPLGTASTYTVMSDLAPEGSLIGVASSLGRNQVHVGLATATLDLKSGTSYAVGVNPTTALTADFNGDGKRDLAVVNAGEGATARGNISILLNNGDGTLRQAVPYNAGDTPLAATAGDFNGDSRVDLAVVNNSSNNVSVLLGNGDGTFRQAVNYATPAAPQSVAVGDINGDGRADLVVAVLKNVSILLGNGDGTFRAAVNVPLDLRVSFVVVADLNKDGRADVGLLDQTAGVAGVLLGNGNGTFQPIVAYGTGYSPEGMFAMDFDFDGNLDLVIAMGDPAALTPNPNSGTISVLFGKGDGTFHAAPYLPLKDTPQQMAIGDLNGDNRPDIVTASSGGLSLFFGQGAERFQAQPPLALPQVGGSNAAPASVVIADLNGDRRGDLVIGDNRRVWVLIGNGNGSFQSPVSYPAAGQVTGIAVADFNGDGRPDVAVASEAGVQMYAGSANGALGAATTLAAGSKPRAVGAADVNGDSRVDLVVVNNGTRGSATDPGGVSVLLGNGNGTFQQAVNYAAGLNPTDLVVTDFDGDGRPDLAVSTSGPNFGFFVGILMGDAGGRFRNVSLITTDFGPGGLAAVDLNGDGKLDLAVTHCCGDTDMTFMQGSGDGTFQRELHIGTLSPAGVVAADLNADGKQDLIVALGGTGSGGVTVLLNTSTPPLVFTNMSGATFQPGPVAPESIVAAVGARLAVARAESQTGAASLAGTTVSVRDSAGATRPASLILASPEQVVYIVPTGTAAGAAAVTITTSEGATGTVSQAVERVAPGLFTQSDGVAIGNIRRVAEDGTQTVDPLTADPIDLGLETDQVTLELLGTGFRFQSSVGVVVGGEDAEAPFAGAQEGAVGVDRVDVRLPKTLAGRGLVDVQLTADGKIANVVRINVK